MCNSTSKSTKSPPTRPTSDPLDKPSPSNVAVVVVRLSGMSLLTILLLSGSIAFGIGRLFASRNHHGVVVDALCNQAALFWTTFQNPIRDNDNNGNHLEEEPNADNNYQQQRNASYYHNAPQPPPPPMGYRIQPLESGEQSMRSTYTFQHYDGPHHIRTSSFLLEDDDLDTCLLSSSKDDDDLNSCNHRDKSTLTTTTATPTDADAPEDIHEPAGQHLLVDFRNVHRDFLQSEERLVGAMQQLIQGSQLTMLSYHCHWRHNHPNGEGISCVGVLLESHVSIHTFPQSGMLYLDLFTCGAKGLVPLLPSIRHLFGIFHPTQNQDQEPGVASTDTDMLWGFKRRGFKDKHKRNYNVEDIDLHWMLGNIGVPTHHVTTVQTQFQRIDIYDVFQRHFSKGQNPYDRVVYLDSVLQSRRYGEVAYHETLVHPAMLTHERPRRVAVIGGGEGATLREVLKHNTVESVVMIEIDRAMVDVSRKYLPEWNDCRLSSPSTFVREDQGESYSQSCFDDPRTTIYYEDAVTWFLERFGENATKNEPGFDVLIMDALDPSSVVEFSDVLYDNINLVRAFSNSLGENGIFVAQVGEADNIDDPDSAHDRDVHFNNFLNNLAAVGLASLMDFDDLHSRLQANWSFLLAMKNPAKSRSKWFRSEAQLQLELHRRNVMNDTFPFHFFDGAGMLQYQFPSRVVEETWCRGVPANQCGTNGHGFDALSINNVPATEFLETRTREDGSHGVFAKSFIPRGSVIALEECVQGILVTPESLAVLEASSRRWEEHSEFWNTVYGEFLLEHGWQDFSYGVAAGIDAGILTFVNYGVNGTHSVGTYDVSLANTPNREIVNDDNDAKEVFHPFDERHFPSWECGKIVALRDIHPGEEVLDGHGTFVGEEEYEHANVVRPGIRVDAMNNHNKRSQ